MPTILVDNKEEDKEEEEEEEMFLALGPSLVIGSLSIGSVSIVALG